MLKKKDTNMDRKGYYRFVLNSYIALWNKKNKQILEYFNYKKYLENGKEK